MPSTPVVRAESVCQPISTVAAAAVRFAGVHQRLPISGRTASTRARQAVGFAPEDEWKLLCAQGYLPRTDQQFHWHNDGYKTFDDFLATLNSRHRKAIKRERRDALSAGITIHWLTGDEIDEDAWDAFFTFYMETGSRKWGRPYLTRTFFSLIGETMRKVAVATDDEDLRLVCMFTPALTGDELGMIFSGSAVIDHAGSAGFGAEAMVAIYTSASDGPQQQVQSLAWSKDHGRSWHKYAGNPVLDEGLADFRDPNVFWHAPSGRWNMVVALRRPSPSTSGLPPKRAEPRPGVDAGDQRRHTGQGPAVGIATVRGQPEGPPSDRGGWTGNLFNRPFADGNRRHDCVVRRSRRQHRVDPIGALLSDG